MLCQAINLYFKQWFTISENLWLDAYTCKHFSSGDLAYIQNSSTERFWRTHYRMLQIAEYFIPFLRHYFRDYQLNQKLVVLKFYENFSVYDPELFASFEKDLAKATREAGGNDEKFWQVLQSICVSQHPISGQDIDRTYELLDVLEFHLKQGEG